MIRTFAFTFSGIFFLACSFNTGNFGEKVDTTKAVTASEGIQNFISSGTKEAIITGEIEKVCQSEGCWFNYKTNTKPFRVDFDHKFEIPKTCSGLTATSSGYFYFDTTSVETLKEWAKDEKKTKAEIESITDPEINIMFRANGVLIEKK